MKNQIQILFLIMVLALAGTAYANMETADNLGKKIGSSYVETLKLIVAIIADKPAAADAMAMLSDMKNWTIELMVGLRKEREALSADDRPTVDRVLSSRSPAYPSDLFKEFQPARAFHGRPGLFTLIADPGSWPASAAASPG